MRWILLIAAISAGSLGFVAGAVYMAAPGPLPPCQLSAATSPDPDEPEPVDEGETLTAELLHGEAD